MARRIVSARDQVEMLSPWRTASSHDEGHPADGEGFDAWRERLWSGVSEGKTFAPNAPGSHYRAMSEQEYQAGLKAGEFRPLLGDHLYVTDDPDRLAGGSFGAKGGGHIVEFSPQPTEDIPSRYNHLMEKGVRSIPINAVRRVWSWNGQDHVPNHPQPPRTARRIHADRVDFRWERDGSGNWILVTRNPDGNPAKIPTGPAPYDRYSSRTAGSRRTSSQDQSKGE